MNPIMERTKPLWRSEGAIQIKAGGRRRTIKLRNPAPTTRYVVFLWISVLYKSRRAKSAAATIVNRNTDRFQLVLERSVPKKAKACIVDWVAVSNDN